MPSKGLSKLYIEQILYCSMQEQRRMFLFSISYAKSSLSTTDKSQINKNLNIPEFKTISMTGIYTHKY